MADLIIGSEGPIETPTPPKAKPRAASAIKVTCGRCGEIKLPARAISVYTYPEPVRNVYTFRCPCGLMYTKPATPAVLNYLASSNIVRVQVTVPDEARERHTGPAITVDDVLDFALGLGAADIDVEDACAPVSVVLPA